MSQAKYIADILTKHNTASCNLVPIPMSTCHYLTKDYSDKIDHASQYKSIIGALQYVTTPMTAFSVNKLG